MAEDDDASTIEEDEERRAQEEVLIAERNAAQRAAEREAGGPTEQTLVLPESGEAAARDAVPGDGLAAGQKSGDR